MRICVVLWSTAILLLALPLAVRSFVDQSTVEDGLKLHSSNRRSLKGGAPKDGFVSALGSAWSAFQKLGNLNAGTCNKDVEDIAGGNYKDLLTRSRLAYQGGNRHGAAVFLASAVSKGLSCSKSLSKNRRLKDKARLARAQALMAKAASLLNSKNPRTVIHKRKPIPRPKPGPKPGPKPKNPKPVVPKVSRSLNKIDACWKTTDWRNNRKAYADCGIGYGKNPGGKRGRIYVVTDDSDPNDSKYNFYNPKPGTLRYAMKLMESESLWVTFDRDMHIQLNQEILVRSDCTIDGRGHTIEITGGQITLKEATNVILSNLIIHDVVPQNSIYGQTGSQGDCVYLFTAKSVWLDHLTLYKCNGKVVDGLPWGKLIDVIWGSKDVTISNCLLHDNMFTILLGASDANQDQDLAVTLTHNWFGPNLDQRQPRGRMGKFHVANNYYYKWGTYALGGSAAPNFRSEHNVFFAPDDPFKKAVCYLVDTTSNNPQYPWGSNAQWVSIGDQFLNGAYFLPDGSPSLGDGIFKPPYDTSWLVPAEEVARATEAAGATII